MKHPAAVALCIVCCLAPATAGPLSVELTVTEPNGLRNVRGKVSTGVPLLCGQVRDARSLRLLDAAGREVTAQFRPLARWWNRDNSLRWVLVDFMTGIGPFETKTFRLTDGGRPRPHASPLKVTAADGTITVTTGAAEFVINRKRFNLFDRIRVDLNGDGQYTPDEQCLGPHDDAGSLVTDTYGRKYLSAEGTESVVVEEAGPIRVCVLAKGMHRAAGGKGYSRGMYAYEVRMHFYAGQSIVRLDPVIHNGLARPAGSPTFDDYSLRLKLNLAPEPLPFDKDHPKVLWTRVYGQAPLDKALTPGQSLLLYQDSNGSETWKVNPGIRSRMQSELSSFRGYQIRLKADAGQTVLARGDHARGLVGIGGKRFGIVIVPRYFWQQFPKAVEVGHDGAVRIGILPGEYKAPHWLDDAGAASQQMWLHFYGRKMAGKAVSQYPRDTRTKSRTYRGLMRDRPKPHVIADLEMPRLVALCTPEHYAACGALADLGPYLPIRRAKGFPLGMTERRYFMTDYLKGNAYGWHVFGCRWEENAGHTPYNYEPILSSDYLFQFITSRHRSWLEFGLRRNIHFRDCRAYQIQGTQPFSARSYDEFKRVNVQEEWFVRPAPTGPEVTRYTKGKYKRAGWYMPDPAHVSVDELYDLYCLFGDNRALAGARNAAAVGGAYAAFRQANVSRLNGWSMRALVRYLDLTGSQEARPYVDRAMDQFWNLARRHRHRAKVPTVSPNSGYEGWFNNIAARGVILAYRVTGDERMRDLALGMAAGRHDEKLRYPTLTAFAWDQTGDARYLHHDPDAFGRYRVEATTQVYSKNYFPACDGYLWAKPRPDRPAPSAVRDLAAVALGNGSVKVSWTAPGDDGKHGRAAVYQLKWSDRPIVEVSRGRDQVNFWAAENVTGEPAPAAAGAAQQMTVQGLRPGRCHFAVKARDEQNNQSPVSNVCSVVVE
ncbi:MAG: exo-rhamnogalacturonan lyase family protein [Planctomycetota bacterium]